MKKMIMGKELQEKMEKAIKQICGAVKTTLGPKGCNAIISDDIISPYITNDGVSIAQMVGSEEKEEDIIMRLASEAAVKTNEMVGDGTTTTLVLVEALFLEGLKRTKAGVNPIILKREMDKATDEVIKKLEKVSQKITKEDIKKIASVASNDEEIGELLSKAVYRVGVDNIVIKEGEEETYFKHLEGYYMDTVIASIYFFQKEANIKWDETNILLLDNYLDDLEEISEIYNYIKENNLNLVIIAKDYSEEVINQVLSSYLENEVNIVLLKMSGYGLEIGEIKKDIEAISQGRIVNNVSLCRISDLGKVKGIEINQEWVKLAFVNNEEINKRKKDIAKEKRGMLDKGIGEIVVGAQTVLERREKKMRFDDALGALKSAQQVLPGGGIVYYELSEEIAGVNEGEQVLKMALKRPIKQILENAGLEENILQEIKRRKFQVLYNVKTGEYEDVRTSKVIDSTKVAVSALKNANSIAGMLLTTTSLIINENMGNLGNNF